MAERVLKSKSLRLLIPNGMTLDGKTKYRSRSYGDLRAEATDDGVLEAAQIIGGLMEVAPESYEVVEVTTLAPTTGA